MQRCQVQTQRTEWRSIFFDLYTFVFPFRLGGQKTRVVLIAVTLQNVLLARDHLRRATHQPLLSPPTIHVHWQTKSHKCGTRKLNPNQLTSILQIEGASISQGHKVSGDLLCLGGWARVFAGSIGSRLLVCEEHRRLLVPAETWLICGSALLVRAPSSRADSELYCRRPRSMGQFSATQTAPQTDDLYIDWLLPQRCQVSPPGQDSKKISRAAATAATQLRTVAAADRLEPTAGPITKRGPQSLFKLDRRLQTFHFLSHDPQTGAQLRADRPTFAGSAGTPRCAP